MTKPFAWSYSRLKNYETCPKRHWHYDIAKDVVEPESGPMLEGNAVHKALELRISQGKRLPLGMTQYEPVMAKLASLPGDVYAEQRLGLTADFKPVGFFGAGVWFRTILDFCNVGDTRATVIDYKTGKPNPDMTQLELMAVTIMHHMPEIERVRASLLFLNHNVIERADYTRGDIMGIWNTILPRVRRVQQAAEDEEYPAKPGGLCKRYCAVTSCPYHGRGSM